MRDFSKTPQYRAFQAKLNAKRRHEDERRAEARELYSDDQGEPVLRDSFVAYIDDLGTKARVASLTDATLREGIAHLEQLREFLDHSWGASPSTYRRFLSFSDNVVVGTPVDFSIDDGGIVDLLSSVLAYQLNMAAGRGRFLRGGIARGPLYIDDRLVIGQGLVDAVLIEKREAIFPRIVVAPDAVQLRLDADKRWRRGKFSSSVYNDLLIDQDERYFLDYLRGGEADEIPGDAERAMTEHRARVLANLYAFPTPGRVRDKYVWVAHYHNYVAAQRFQSEPSFLITTELTQEERLSPRVFRPVYS